MKTIEISNQAYERLSYIADKDLIYIKDQLEFMIYCEYKNLKDKEKFSSPVIDLETVLYKDN